MEIYKSFLFLLCRFRRNKEKKMLPHVARHFNLLNYCSHNITICYMSLHQWNTESRKKLEKKNHLSARPLNPRGINEHLLVQLIYSFVHFTIFPTTHLSTHALTKGQCSKHQLLYLFTVEIWTLSTSLTLNFNVSFFSTFAIFTFLEKILIWIYNAIKVYRLFLPAQ